MASTLLALRQHAVRRSLAATRALSSASSSTTSTASKPLSDMLRELKASEHFDLIVIGSGPAGQKCAIDHAKHGKSVAVIDKRDMLGGVCIHTGTVPSKTFREATLHLTAYRHRSFYDGQSNPTKRFGIEDILQRVKKVEHAETDITRHQLLRNNIELINGTARFLPDAGKKMVAVLSNDSYTTATDAKRHSSADICKRVLTADKFLIAVGTRPARRPDIPFDGETIFDSDQLLWGGVKSVPKRLIVVGAGVIGMEYASMMSIIPGMEVTIIDGRKEILDMADREVSEALCYSMRQTGARFFVEETIKSVEKADNGEVIVHLNSGKTLVGDGLLYTLGRQGNTEGLNLAAVGLEADKRGLIQVDDNFQTDVPHIYAAGDCIGFPALASTSMEQGRLASVHMCTSKPTNKKGESETESTDPQYMRTRMRSGEVFPFGIYTVPEISMVGKNEQQLTSQSIPYEVGVARYEELAKGQMLGGVPGFLKIIFCPKTLQVLGVHAIGEGATEIIHIGQVVMSTGGTIEYFRNAVFNYPTLAEAYRVAALNGLRKVESLRKQTELSSLPRGCQRTTGLVASKDESSCDLNEEQIEEIRMLASLPVKEIQRIRKKYRSIAQHEDMTKGEFYALPAIAANPLRDRLFQNLGLSEEKTIPFAEFAKFVPIFSFHSSRETKRREAFHIHDFDGDGKISRADLRAYLEIVYPQKVEKEDENASAEPDDAVKNRQEVLELLVSRIMEEASSDPAMEVLLYDDFVKFMPRQLHARHCRLHAILSLLAAALLDIDPVRAALDANAPQPLHVLAVLVAVVRAEWLFTRVDVREREAATEDRVVVRQGPAVPVRAHGPAWSCSSSAAKPSATARCVSAPGAVVAS